MGDGATVLIWWLIRSRSSWSYTERSLGSDSHRSTRALKSSLLGRGQGLSGSAKYASIVRELGDGADGFRGIHGAYA